MNSDTIKPVLNPFVLLLKVSTITFFVGLLIHAVRIIVINPKDFISPEIIIPGFFIFLFFTYVAILTVFDLKNSFKFVRFSKHEIYVFYPLRLKRVRYDKVEIRGFTTCKIRYNLNSMILYTFKNEIIEFTSKDIFDFKSVAKYLKRNFDYLGEEHFLPNTWIGRKYKYQIKQKNDLQQKL